MRDLLLCTLEAKLGKSVTDTWFSNLEIEVDKAHESIITEAWCMQPNGAACMIRKTKDAQVSPIVTQCDGTVVSILNQTNTKVKINFPSLFIRNWISSHYYSVITDLIMKIWGISNIEIGVYQTKHNVKQLTHSGTLISTSTPLNPKFTLDSFMIDACNKFGYELGKKFLETESYPCIVFRSASGNGKTHLVQAIATEAILRGYTVTYIHAQEYTRQFVNAIQNNTLSNFKNTFLDSDIFIIDDLHLLKGKRATQEMLMELLLYFFLHNKRICMSINDYEVLDINTQLHSFILSSLITNIENPSKELKFRILKNKSESQPFFTDEILMFIIENVKGSIRELEGALLRIRAHLEFFGGSINIQNAMNILRDVHIKQKKEITPELIMTTVAQFYNIKQHLLYSKVRTRVLTNAKRVAMFLLRDICKQSFSDIGKLFGNTSHTNALQSIKRVYKDVSISTILRHEIQSIRVTLNES